MGLSAPLASSGEVNITVSTEALSSKELCGNEMPVVPAQGSVDTVIKPLLVQVRWVMEKESGMGLSSLWGTVGGLGVGQHPDPSPGCRRDPGGQGDVADPFS